MAKTEKDINYIRWQNRAFDFYLAARTCCYKGFGAPAAFLSQQCLEQLVKATLIWWQPSFDPKNDGGHNLRKMSEMIRENVPDQNDFTVPEYICKYQSLSRYPDGRGFGYPRLEDVDKLFADLIEMVPFQRNSQLFRTLICPDSRVRPSEKVMHEDNYAELERRNEQIKRLYNHVVVQGNPGHRALRRS